MILRIFNCFSATSVGQFSAVIVTEGASMKLQNKGKSVAFQIATWKERRRNKKTFVEKQMK